MTLQLKNWDKYPPHMWLDVQRSGFVREKTFQRNAAFWTLGPNAGADGPRMAELARSSSGPGGWAKWPHTNFRETWSEDDQVELRRTATLEKQAQRGPDEDFHMRWMKPRQPFPPLGIKPALFQDDHGERGERGDISSLCTSASSSCLTTPVGTPSGSRRRPAPVHIPMPATLTRLRVHEVPKERPVDPRIQQRELAAMTPFRIQHKAPSSAAAANTPKAWELTKDFDSGPGWGYRRTLSAESMGLTR
eukprot:TRINITY_DN91241_c0_g1_i1.p1 TRINITY_DN91241_c0_g1~~TRINITY_DN91241_c0_g1_i1.p1  ORF type:complete len:248 (-),score=26.01 TRINITY_DN91241_c0_g1_i1:87-830(-)